MACSPPTPNQSQILSVGQQVVFELQGLNLRIVVGSLLVSDAAGENKDVARGFLADSTAFIFTNAGEGPRLRRRAPAASGVAQLVGWLVGCIGAVGWQR